MHSAFENTTLRANSCLKNIMLKSLKYIFIINDAAFKPGKLLKQNQLNMVSAEHRNPKNTYSM